MKEKDIKNIFELCKSYMVKILDDEEIIREVREIYGLSINELKFENKYISDVLYHSMGLHPCKNVQIDILKGNKKIGYYSLYLEDDNSFKDEFFVLD